MMGRPIRRAVVFVAAGAGTYALGIRPWKRRWNATLEEAAMVLPGDEVIKDPSAMENRAVSIEAPPSAVWPWLVQMGLGRAGWYSYDRLDMTGHSADRVMPEFQHLQVADLMPTHPAGGFKVAALEPDRCLVLYLDTALVKEQAARAGGTTTETTPQGLRASARLFERSFTEFAATWTFYLKPVAPNRTRLIQRLRVATPPAGIMARPFGALTGFGIFLMQRKQFLGIKERAERVWREQTGGMASRTAA